MPQINKNLFLAAIFGPYAVQWILTLIGQLLQFFGNSSMATVAAGFSCFGLLFAIVSVVFFAMSIYKVWETIQGEHARTTPGKACGFMFIPFFNFYWIFVALWGWAKDFNTYTEKEQVDSPKMAEGLTLATCIVIVSSVILGLIPFVGLLTGLVNATLLFLFITKAIDGANAVRATKAPPPEPAV